MVTAASEKLSDIVWHKFKELLRADPATWCLSEEKVQLKKSILNGELLRCSAQINPHVCFELKSIRINYTYSRTDIDTRWVCWVFKIHFKPNEWHFHKYFFLSFSWHICTAFSARVGFVVKIFLILAHFSYMIFIYIYVCIYV